jgi:hypothetical protein
LASPAKQKQVTLARSAKEIFPDIDVLCTFRHCGLAAADRRAPLHAINTNQNLIGLVNASGVSIHHPGNRALICPLAFILRERAPPMVNHSFASAGKAPSRRVPA